LNDEKESEMNISVSGSEREPVTEESFRELVETSDRLVAAVSTERHRSLYPAIDWRDRLVCVKGARGTGKTTILLQRIREAFGAGSSKALYASLDDLWFANRRLKDLAAWLDSHGFTHLFLDEVHHLPDWSLQIKNVCDQFPALNVVYSGSSLLQIEKAAGDLSRRQATYPLEGLSFREFLAFEGVLEHDGKRGSRAAGRPSRSKRFSRTTARSRRTSSPARSRSRCSSGISGRGSIRSGSAPSRTTADVSSPR